MAERYKVFYEGSKTRIMQTPAGEWPRWNMARVAAIEHVEEVLAEAQDALDTLRRSGNTFEYQLRRQASCRR